LLLTYSLFLTSFALFPKVLSSSCMSPKLKYCMLLGLAWISVADLLHWFVEYWGINGVLRGHPTSLGASWLFWRWFRARSCLNYVWKECKWNSTLPFLMIWKVSREYLPSFLNCCGNFATSFLSMIIYLEIS
jgi:hypothetical protein